MWLGYYKQEKMNEQMAEGVQLVLREVVANYYRHFSIVREEVKKAYAGKEKGIGFYENKYDQVLLNMVEVALYQMRGIARPANVEEEHREMSASQFLENLHGLYGIENPHEIYAE